MSVRIEGLRDLEETLRDFSKTTSKNVLRRALLTAARPIAASAENRAPRLRGHLKASIGEGTKLSRRQKSMHKAESDVEVFVGPGALPQAITQEFGTVNHPPQPFMRPAWDENGTKSLHIFRDEFKVEINKAAARAKKKAEKNLLKMKKL